MQPMPEDWSRGVAVVAHPDDLEYGAASAVARWTGQGKSVSYVIVSSGEAGIAGQDPVTVGPLREEEERRSAAVVGVTDVQFLGHPDGLSGATAALLEWAQAEGLTWDVTPADDGDRWGARLEIYETDPAEQPDLNKWVTQLAFRLAD